MNLAKHTTSWIAIALSLLLAAPALADSCRVVEVLAGDTLTVEPVEGGDRGKVRLHGIDAPEMRQPYGQAAQVFVINAVLYKTVDIRPAAQGKDHDGRIMAVVEIPGVGILQELLLTEGLARVSPQLCKDCDAWEALQEEARGKRKGLWGGEPAEPWEWSRLIKEAKTLKNKK